jgi:hypothetical protein
MRKIVTSLVRLAEQLRLPCDCTLGGDIAIFSPDRKLRYVVTRKLGESSRVLAAIGLNPSKADAFRNDPTVKRCINFAAAWGCGLYVMLNASAFRATEPSDMAAAARDGIDVVGPHNATFIAAVFELLGADDVALAAWGVNAEFARVQRIAGLAYGAGIQLACLGMTKSGAPRHPLYVHGSTMPQPWSGPR